MGVRLDAAGNVIGRYAPAGAAGPAFLLGSHLDTVRDAGRYDGILGVTLAIAAVEGVRRRGLTLPFPLEVLAFSEEEGARFGVPFLGSRAIVGSYDPELLARRDAQGVSVAEAIRDFGNDPAALPAAEIAAPAAFGYLEAHIEQGPVLESLGAPLGLVSAITSQSRLTLTFGGRSGHAGTTPMGARRDALGGAAAFVLLAEAEGLATPGLVATVGQIAARPGSANVIPGRVTLSLDVRHPDAAVRRAAVERMLAAERPKQRRRRLEMEATPVFEHAAVPCDAALSAVLRAALGAMGLAARVWSAERGTTPRCSPRAGRWRCSSCAAPAGSATTRTRRCCRGTSPWRWVRWWTFWSAWVGNDPGGRPTSRPEEPAAVFDLVVRGGTVVTPEGAFAADVAVEAGRSCRSGPACCGATAEEIDATGLHVFPGLIDAHVHFNEPGRTEWEGFDTGLRGPGGRRRDVLLRHAAEQPPADARRRELRPQARRRAEANSRTDFALWGGLTPGNLDGWRSWPTAASSGSRRSCPTAGSPEFPATDD